MTARRTAKDRVLHDRRLKRRHLLAQVEERELDFRTRLAERVGAAPGESYDSYHVFPVEFDREFAALGLDVYDVEYGRWIDASVYEDALIEYVQEWGAFLVEEPTLHEVFEFARILSEKYGLESRLEPT